ncbi:hypothetical protein EV177_002893 [Coemansia sp. RSA 1804]|nr:hypothetical protein EV177_002893 [Coemansia sp. RSA 1804]
MHINSLSNEIFAKIFYWTCNQVDMQQQAHYALSKWKTKLVLLSVCQKWRELAAPSVHDTSFVSCTIIRRSKAKGGSTWPYFSDLSWFDRRVEKYAVMSNLDIVDTDNSSNVAPGSLQIFVEASVNPIYSLRGIVDKLRAHRQLLKDVKRLELFTVNRSVYSWNSDNANAVEADFIGKDITQVVPSVEYIEWQMANDAPVVLGLAQSLIKSYARQLRGFSYPQAGLTKVFGFSDKLTYACVNGGNAESGYLPPVWTDNLAVLDLNLVRDNIDWSSFQNTNGPGADLWFPSLRRLRLVALDTTLGNSNAKNTISAADGHPALSGFGYNVIAPKLETLTVVPSPLTHSFVASIYGVAIGPITLDVTKQLARLYPPPSSSQSSTSTTDRCSGKEEEEDEKKDDYRVLDSFFAADFIPPRIPKGGTATTTAAANANTSSNSLAQQLMLASFDHESYGVKYVRYLHQFAHEQYLKFDPAAYTGTRDGIRLLGDACAAGIAADIASLSTTKWDDSRVHRHRQQKHKGQQKALRERMLAHTILLQACIEQNPPLDDQLGKPLADEFWTSKVPSLLWSTIRIHRAQQCASTSTAAAAAAAASSSSNQSDVSRTAARRTDGTEALGAVVVQLDELEVAIELLYLFSSLARRMRIDIAAQFKQQHQSAAEVVRLAMDLFASYSRHSHRRRHHHHSHNHNNQRNRHAQQGPGDGGGGGEAVEVGRLQRVRLGHKALLLLEVTWALLLGDESKALYRLTGSSSSNNSKSGDVPSGGSVLLPLSLSSSARTPKGSGIARDALRQISTLVDKYPMLADDVRADVDRLLPFVHPFDGHLTRTSQLSRFGPIPALKQQQQQRRSGLLSLSLPPAMQPDVPGAKAAIETAAAYARQQQRQNATATGISGVDADGAVVHPDLYLPQPATIGAGERRPWLSSRPPRAARECVEACVASVRFTRSEREYCEWWRRLVQARGMPLSLTLNAAGRKGMNSDITINYNDKEHAASSVRSGSVGAAGPAQYEFCGVVEAEDLPALEKLLDDANDDDDASCVFQWPSDTDIDPTANEINSTNYRSIFPLLPALCKAIVLTIVNWSPTEKEFPPRQFLINVGPPQVSDATCLGVVKYPRPQPTSKATSGCDSKVKDANDESGSSSSSSSSSGSSNTDTARPTSPLSGSNVKRLERSSSSTSVTGDRGSGNIQPLPGNSTTAAAGGINLNAPKGYVPDPVPPVPAELGARLVSQYAQWQAIGRLMMSMMLGLQANHVLQADYAAQLLMNENLIPAMFWWLGTANLDYCLRLPVSVTAHTFMAEYSRVQQNRRKQNHAAAHHNHNQLHSPPPDSSSNEGAVSVEGADPAAVGRDVSDSEEPSSKGLLAVCIGPSSLESASQAKDQQNSPSDIPIPKYENVENVKTPSAKLWKPALDGLNLCLRSLRRLTSHNGLRKGLLYKNKALYFYSRLIRVPSTNIQQTAAELYRDIMPVVSKKQKQAILDTVSQVYLHAPSVSLGDTFWLAEYSLDPQIEMHRHVELLRLLHFYHYEAFGLRLPRDPALFPSLVKQTIVVADSASPPSLGAANGYGSAANNTSSQTNHRHGTTAATANRSTVQPLLPKNRQQSGGSDYSWALWESDLENTLDEVYSPPRSHHSLRTATRSTGNANSSTSVADSGSETMAVPGLV